MSTDKTEHALKDIFEQVAESYGAPGLSPSSLEGDIAIEVAKRFAALTAAPPAQQQSEPTMDRESTWWALAMGAAASLEDAALCMRDADAKRAATAAAAHVRKQCAALAATPPSLQEPQEAGPND